MNVYTWKDILAGAFPRPPEGTALSVGSFDGPHRGHKALFDALLAHAPPLQGGLITFAEPPAAFYDRASFPGTVATLEERLLFFQKRGFNFAVVVDFSEEFAKIEGDRFLEILVEQCGLALLVESEEFRLGHRGAFDVEAIEKVAKTRGFRFQVVPPVLCWGQRISSTRVRQAILQGDRALAESLLGHGLSRPGLVQVV
jgi:FAD synthase